MKPTRHEGVVEVAPKDLVVFVDEREGSKNRIAYAAALAKRWRAHLIVTFIVPRLELNRHAGFAVGSGLSRMLDQHQGKVEQALQGVRNTFDVMVKHRSFTSEWRVSDNEIGEELMLHARHASLAIIGPSSQAGGAETALGLSERIIFASGRPTLLLPADWPAERMVRRIVIGWNASREATRAIADAMPFLVEAEAVELVVVPEARAGGPFGADPGADIARHLARNGVRIELRQCEGADAGSALLDTCRESEAELLVMGAMGRSRISEFVFGGAMRTVLETMNLPVLLSR